MSDISSPIIVTFANLTVALNELGLANSVSAKNLFQVLSRLDPASPSLTLDLSTPGAVAGAPIESVLEHRLPDSFTPAELERHRKMKRMLMASISKGAPGPLTSPILRCDTQHNEIHDRGQEVHSKECIETIPAK